MSDRYSRLGFVLLILAFPRLIQAFADREEPTSRPAPPRASARASIGVEGIQALLLIGLTLAGRERVRLRSLPSS